ncbi:carbohydrate kinase family protein [Segetibacter sp.]|jgi:sugar/nucleoside kinase (ribokinase family)|uniref:carbohydrate kinase family protein n=1 Tax=Segetibacter sp. TaxID=2231182 RepID=UPI00262801DB|nr:carbohydrate kinase family protein [Segetibacter sp.]MCW3078601.1 sugar kinase, ribokinase [Segetibacter sp.]
MKKDVLVTGELNVDILLNKVRGFPVIGQEILADEMTFTLGSSSAIFASNLASLGIGTSFCGIVGNDIFGKYILSELNDKKVDTRLITEESKYQTGVTIILNYEQDRANVTHCGAMEHFNVSNIPVDELSQYRHLHLSSFFLQKGLQKDIVRLFKTARENGLSTSLDIQWDPANEWAFPYKQCLPYVDFFLPNEAEVLALTDTAQLSDAFDVLDAFANTIVVKRGVHGALAYSKGTYTEAEPYLHSLFVDAIGAGDSFNAGFISSYLQGKSLQESLMFGNLTGAINTTGSGGTGAFSDLSSFVKKARTIFNIEI